MSTQGGNIGLSLSVLFDRGEIVHQKAESSRVSEEELKDAIAWLTQCEQLVGSAALFSANEEVDDIATTDLKFLLVPSLLADLQASTRERDPQARLELLEDASASYSRFLHGCELYGISLAEVRAAGQPTDPTTRRQQKIDRLRKEKAAKARLEALQMAQMRRKRIIELDEAAVDASGDDESEREAWLLRVELAVLKAVDNISILKQEADMLQHAQSLPAEQRSRPAAPPPEDLMAQLRQAAANLGGQREQLQQQVFRPSHNLPTRSLREQAEIEIAEAQRVAEAEQKAAAARAAKGEQDVEDDAEVQKQRAWDDWTDVNPRGAGNSKLRPTA